MTFGRKLFPADCTNAAFGGKIFSERTPKGHRRYDLNKILGRLPYSVHSNKQTIGYARVSSHDQKEDLKRQIELLSSFEDDLVNDVLEIITVFSARLDGARSRKNKKLIEAFQEAAKDL